MVGTITLPVPNPNCPSPGSGGGLMSVIGGAINHIPVIGDVSKVAEMVGTMLGTIVAWISSPGQMAHDIGGWFTFNAFGYNVDAPNCYQPTSAYGFARSVLLGDINISGSPVYHDAYIALAGVGFALVFLGGMARLVKRMQSPDHPIGHLIIDVIPRILLGLAGIEVAFQVINTALPVASQFGTALLGQLAGIALGAYGSALRDPLALVLFGGVTSVLGTGLYAVILIPVLLLFLVRVLALLVARFLIVSMAIAFTPVIIAIAVFDSHATVVRWWWTMMWGAFITPIVCAGMLGITLGLSVRFAQGDQSLSSFFVGPLVGAIIAIGGLWLTGKAIRALLFASTSGRHEGALAFMRHSVETAASIPFAAASVVRGAGMLKTFTAGAAGGPALALTGAGAMAATKAGGSLSPTASFSSFRSNSAGMSTAQAATPELPIGTPPSARWAHLLGKPELSAAVTRLQGASAASAARTGDATPSPAERRAFIAAARALSPSEAKDSKQEEAS